LVQLWVGLFHNENIGLALLLVVIFTYGFIYDRRQARKLREFEATQLGREH
jgi:hypothetical protein